MRSGGTVTSVKWQHADRWAYNLITCNASLLLKGVLKDDGENLKSFLIFRLFFHIILRREALGITESQPFFTLGLLVG